MTLKTREMDLGAEDSHCRLFFALSWAPDRSNCPLKTILKAFFRGREKIDHACAIYPDSRYSVEGDCSDILKFTGELKAWHKGEIINAKPRPQKIKVYLSFSASTATEDSTRWIKKRWIIILESVRL